MERNRKGEKKMNDVLFWSLIIVATVIVGWFWRKEYIKEEERKKEQCTLGNHVWAIDINTDVEGFEPEFRLVCDVCGISKASTQEQE